MSKAAWIIFASVIVLLIGGLVIYSRFSNPGMNVSAFDQNAIISANEQNGNIGDHTFGNTQSKVVLIEYGDFQCPSCGGAHPQIKEITEEYKDKIVFIFRNLPLTSAHPNALAAAGAVEAAGLQGKYWEMHNLIFETQSEWSNLTGTERTDVFAGYAEQLGLNKDQFIADLSSKAVNAKLAFDQAIFKATKYDKATPTFVLNGEKISEEVSGATVKGSTTELKALLDSKIGE